MPGHTTKESTMSTLIFSNLVTVDGFAAGPGGNVMVLPLDESFSGRNVELLREAGTILLGATTYAGFTTYWPGIADDESQPPVEREISRLNGRLPKVVVSDSLTPEDCGPWRETTEIVRRADARARIEELRAADGGDIVVFGSTTLGQWLLAEGLVDELHLMVGAGLLGEGLSPFGPTAAELSLLEVRRLEGSDNVLLRYAVRH
jgi:dihydrofolate reductase